MRQGGGRAGELGMQLAGFGLSGLTRMHVSGKGCLLTFHRVSAPGQWEGLPNRDFHVDPDFLGRLLDYLVRTGWAVVTLDEALERMRAGRAGSRFVNFSIDDVYRDTYERLVPIFRQRGLPVTLFVTTGIPDRSMTLWSAGLESILLARDSIVLEDGSEADAGTATQKRALFARLSALWESDEPEARYQRFCAAHDATPAELHERHAVTWDMLEELRDDPCVEIGGHTVTHPRLSTLPEQQARQEIAGCRERLHERLGLPVRHFAFPYGRKGDCGPREFDLAREAGYVTAATTRKGLVGSDDLQRPYSLPRNTLNGAHQSTSQIETHLSGLGGLVARVLQAT
jgi:peptidoglycan/xylan/chitin deacetylase (PgdA/CDA1 family)